MSEANLSRSRRCLERSYHSPIVCFRVLVPGLLPAVVDREGENSGKQPASIKHSAERFIVLYSGLVSQLPTNLPFADRIEICEAAMIEKASLLFACVDEKLGARERPLNEVAK